MDSEGQSGVTAADEQFLAAFEAGQIANQDFHHRDHLRLAWIQIRRLGLPRASEAVATASVVSDDVCAVDCEVMIPGPLHCPPLRPD